MFECWMFNVLNVELLNVELNVECWSIKNECKKNWIFSLLELKKSVHRKTDTQTHRQTDNGHDIPSFWCRLLMTAAGVVPMLCVWLLWLLPSVPLFPVLWRLRVFSPSAWFHRSASAYDCLSLVSALHVMCTLACFLGDAAVTSLVRCAWLLWMLPSLLLIPVLSVWSLPFPLWFRALDLRRISFPLTHALRLCAPVAPLILLCSPRASDSVALRPRISACSLALIPVLCVRTQHPTRSWQTRWWVRSRLCRNVQLAANHACSRYILALWLFFDRSPPAARFLIAAIDRTSNNDGTIRV